MDRSIRSILCALLLAGLPMLALGANINAQPPYGTLWCASDATGCGPAIITVFPDGSYFEASWGIPGPDDDGQPGIERGTYTYAPDLSTPDTAFVQFTATVDTNGGWGTDPHGNHVRISATEVDVLDHNMPTLYRLGPAPGLLNGWATLDGSGQMSVLAFLPDGHYMYGIESAQSTVEFGSYAWDPSTGLLTVSKVNKSGTDQGLAGLTNLRLSLSSTHLSLTSDQEQLAFTASSVPEPATALLCMLGGLGLAARLRRHSGRRS